VAGLVEDLISGVIKSAVSEVLKKSFGASTTGKRAKRRSTASTTAAKRPAAKKRASAGSSGGGVAPSLPAPESGTVAKPAKKQVSRRRTSAARAKAKRS